jgi:D-3-phosphoglycerate dehydrogenase / 2-oxoglutarate reductase
MELTTFEQVVERADFLTIHVPLKESTRHLIDASVLARMKPGSFLINLARGGVVDEAALLQALRTGDRLAGAALDVHQQEGEGKISPLADLPNVMLTPHIGATTVDTQREIGRRVLQVFQSYMAEMQYSRAVQA